LLSSVLESLMRAGVSMQEEKVFFASAEATPLRLEGVLHTALGRAAAHPGVVVCHPHSLHGGSMAVPVITAAARELAKRGMAALRFNFRGVGLSEGRFGDGVAEVADVAGAIEYLVARDDVDPHSIYLMGYSFGASVGLRYIESDPCIAAVVALCLPLEAASIGSLEKDFWESCSTPKLFLAGDRDHICPLAELQALVQRLPEPKQLIVLEGADHFLWGREEEVAGAIGDYLEALS
jgi:alpha/beta superfamily hydrolase